MLDVSTAHALPEPKGAPFLGRREIILSVMTLGAGHFCEETDIVGTTYRTAADWLKVHDGEHVARLIRFDLEALNGEDVTETVADAWLDSFDHSPAEDHLMPGFVRTSDAFDRWCADFDARRAPHAQATHGTLNHRQQFGSPSR